VRKLKEYKVLIDVNILISASIFYVIKEFKFSIKHRSYDVCKSLFNFFKKNVDRKIGIYTKKISSTSERVLEDAILKTIREKSKFNKKSNEKSILEYNSIIYSECVRNLEENKEYLIRETVNEQKINKLMSDVLIFFRVKMKNAIEKKNPKQKIEKLKERRPKYWLNKIKKQVRIYQAKNNFPFYFKLHNKFVNSGPGVEDIELLAQAIYFNNIFSKKNVKFYFASMDHHFVEIEEKGKINDFIPLEIKKKYGVECLKPDKILNIIKST